MSTPLPSSWFEPQPVSSELDERHDLATLVDAAEALSGVADLRTSLKNMLLVLQRQYGVAQATIAVLDEQSGQVALDASVGSGSLVTHRRRRLDGHAAQAAIAGEPRIIPRARAGLLHVIVPIVLQQVVVGVLDLELTPPTADSPAVVRFASVLACMVARAIETTRLVEAERERAPNANRRVTAVSDGAVGGLIGTSGAMRAVHEQIAAVAKSTATVLIRGESGTGKELIAEAIHARSPRAKKPLVTVNCAALPRHLLEAELFGYEKGAFTGAVGPKKGRFDLAAGGTLFLDEIAEVDPALQIKLQRVLQSREYDRLGGTETLHADVRIIAATNKDLEKAIVSGSFRDDLYHRLNVFTIFVPPLRQRKPDVLLLADEFLHRFATEHSKPVRRIATPAIDMLMSYHWPGNVRELANAIERAIVVCDGGVLLAHHLPPTLQTAETSGTAIHGSLTEIVEAVEKDAIQDALKTARGNRAVAARLLRTTARIFNYKIRNYGIDWRRFRT